MLNSISSWHIFHLNISVGEEKFVEKAEIVATIPAENKWKPSYYHSFAITENFFIMLEQPLLFDLWTVISCKIKRKPSTMALKWIKDKMVFFFSLEKKYLYV